MGYPDGPSISTSYTGKEQEIGDGSFPGQELDVDFGAVRDSIDAIIAFTKKFARSDGKLNNALVTRETLAADITLGFDAPTTWASGVDYKTPNTVFHDDAFYICVADHTSSDFATDLVSGRWALLVDFGAKAQEAAASATAAAGSASAAAASESNAASSASAAATSESNAASSASAANTSAAAAAGSASAANTSASAAATSETNAAGSATAAAGSASAANTSATAAAGSASNASSSETNAAASATAAAGSASAAATSATNAQNWAESDLYNFASRADAQAATVPAPVNKITVLHEGCVLTYRRDASGTALSTNGAAVNWSPTFDDVTPLHWGAIGDGSDETALVHAMYDWVATKNGDNVFLSDAKNTFGARMIVRGRAGKVFGLSSSYSPAAAHRNIMTTEISFEAIGTWSGGETIARSFSSVANMVVSGANVVGEFVTTTNYTTGDGRGETYEIVADGTSENPDGNLFIQLSGVAAQARRVNLFMFDCGGLATYMLWDNVNVNCGDRCGFLHARARHRITGYNWIDRVRHIGISCAGSDVWITPGTIVGQWTTNDAQYYDKRCYSGVGVHLEESDARVIGVTGRWLHTLLNIESTNNIIQHCHMFNGMQGYHTDDRDAALNDDIDAHFGWAAGTAAVTNMDRRDTHVGVQYYAQKGGVVGASQSSSIDNVYWDNCHHELYADTLHVSKNKYGSKASSSLRTALTIGDATKYGDAATVDYWWRLHAYEAGCKLQFDHDDFETFVSSAERRIVKFVPRGGFSWAATTAGLNDSDLNLAARVGDIQLGDGFTIRPPETRVGDPFQGPLVTYLGLRDNVRLAYANSSQDNGPTEVRILGDEYQIRPKGVTAFKVGEDRVDVNALSIGDDLSPLNKPVVIIGIGASNIASTTGQIDGRRDIPEGVYAWDSNSHAGGNYVAGTQFNAAAFGTNPLNAGAGPANNSILQAAINIREETGRPVYMIILAKSGHAPENFLDDGTLDANSWTRPASTYDLSAFYSNLNTALAAVPGSPSVADAIYFYATKDADLGWSVFHPKVRAVFDKFVSEGIASEDKTRVLMISTSPGRETDWRDYKISMELERLSRTNMATVETHGLGTLDGVHFTGDGLTELGKRMAAAFLGDTGTPYGQALVLGNETDIQQNSYTMLHHQGGYIGVWQKANDDKLIEISMNSNTGVWNFNYDPGTGEENVLKVQHGTGIEVAGDSYVSGRVGIGIPSPQTPLHVSGTILIENAVPLFDFYSTNVAATGYARSRMLQDDDLFAWTSRNSGGTFVGNNLLCDISTSGYVNWRFFTSNIERVRIDDNGLRVGLWYPHRKGGDLTVTAGSITPNSGFHNIDDGGGAGVTITDVASTNAVNGTIVVFERTTGSGSITFQHGTGNIRCGADKVLSTNHSQIMFIRSGTNWKLLSFEAN